jgi:hypothetical protein
MWGMKIPVNDSIVIIESGKLFLNSFCGYKKWIQNEINTIYSPKRLCNFVRVDINLCQASHFKKEMGVGYI